MSLCFPPDTGICQSRYLLDCIRQPIGQSVPSRFGDSVQKYLPESLHPSLPSISRTINRSKPDRTRILRFAGVKENEIEFRISLQDKKKTEVELIKVTV